jgi:hypothetical protein
MRKLLLAATAAALLALPGSASAVNSGPDCTFAQGTTTCTTTHGSHGSTSEHQGSLGSSGTSKNPPSDCKVTGSDHAC